MEIFLLGGSDQGAVSLDALSVIELISVERMKIRLRKYEF